MAFDLNAYFARIHFSGNFAPDLHTLRQLHLLHTCAIPFENLDVLLGRRILLDDDSVFEKLVTAGRGGYCYEQNALLRRALLAIGYQVEDLAARVLIARPERVPARTHRLQLVTVGRERWLTDVGFGGKTLTAPLRFELNSEQTTPHGTYRLTRLDEDYLLSLREGGDWLPLYRFDLQPQYFADYEVANHYVATWPESHFRHHLMLCLHVHNGSTVTLSNRQLTVGGEKHELADAAAVYQTLQSRLGLRLDSPKHGIDCETFAAAFNLISAR
ncbi:arylamine N-acetyltransferase [Enterobacteriaceae bacterium H20N1]|uniref:Arylamine N-acetyltransferase n=1 Tax=Dryocola boscaweniae TaxID=2925397 RepID=A0A9X2WBS4_9ENTR|nr:arylamine N-acetyltransferase [Dryocola boscaweniae]MCT4704023.1 arylamine N-acetyltransferase [Dryocola boscaweniae]MCT4721191.1 arylamine N-acetyltransferase [Dryocola boscaweniae]